ncbi:RnfH family protein [Serratia microhaemolytica]|uniref:RnfH family protein n=1 Tax=Serratia microhaemolytica TaxID=2675110 RepID=UPI000FDE48D5|nr:RnfH family protein [Serratia microhaemolytica]
MSEISVEVVYALPERQYLRQVKVPADSTIEQAIVASGLLELRRDIDLSSNRVGIYSRLAKLDDRVSEGDRIEIYRPLLADPKELRRLRAEKGKK